MPETSAAEERIIPLAIAAQQLGVSRERACRMVLTGALKGELKAGRWHVESKSLERARQQFAKSTAAA